MRSLVCVSLAAMAACGGGNRTEANDFETPPLQFHVTLDVTGTGTVRGAGKSCSDHCVWQVPAGALHFEAVPAANWQFQAWNTACASASCDLTVDREVSLTATFTQSQQRPPAPPVPPPPPAPPEVPAPPPMQSLSVTIVGEGRVVSTPAGIDCTATCAADFPKGTRVTLTAAPAPGLLFAEFDGSCSGIDECALALTWDMSVTATFAPIPPPPPPGRCDGLMPASVPAPISIPLEGVLLAGTSDASGTDFVFTTSADFRSPRHQHFVRIENGSANELRSIESDTFALSQPEAFDFFPSSDRAALFDVRAPDGTLLRTVSSGIPLQEGESFRFSEYQPVPGGGDAVLTYVGVGTTIATLRYSGFDRNGEFLRADVPIDLDGAFLVAWGVDFSGNVLLLGGKGEGPFTDNPSFARWLDPRGAPLTDWFAVGDVYFQNDWFVPIPGGLALMVAGECCGDFSLVFASGEASVRPAPSWLFNRSALRLFPIHDGNALVALPAARNGEPVLGPCGPQIEVLAGDGTTCGCVPATAQFGVGRDGSAITSGFVSGRTVFQVYPGLFR